MRAMQMFFANQMRVAWVSWLGYAGAMSVAWIAARLVTHWLLAGSVHEPLVGRRSLAVPHEIYGIAVELVVASVAAYLAGAFALSLVWVMQGIRAVGSAEGVSPVLLFLVGRDVIGGLQWWLFVGALVLLVPVLTWLTALCVCSLLAAVYCWIVRPAAVLALRAVPFTRRIIAARARRHAIPRGW